MSPSCVGGVNCRKWRLCVEILLVLQFGTCVELKEAISGICGKRGDLFVDSAPCYWTSLWLVPEGVLNLLVCFWGSGTVVFGL